MLSASLVTFATLKRTFLTVVALGAAEESKAKIRRVLVTEHVILGYFGSTMKISRRNRSSLKKRMVMAVLLGTFTGAAQILMVLITVIPVKLVLVRFVFLFHSSSCC